MDIRRTESSKESERRGAEDAHATDLRRARRTEKSHAFSALMPPFKPAAEFRVRGLQGKPILASDVSDATTRENEHMSLRDLAGDVLVPVPIAGMPELPPPDSQGIELLPPALTQDQSRAPANAESTDGKPSRGLVDKAALARGPRTSVKNDIERRCDEADDREIDRAELEAIVRGGRDELTPEVLVLPPPAVQCTHETKIASEPPRPRADGAEWDRLLAFAAVGRTANGEAKVRLAFGSDVMGGLAVEVRSAGRSKVSMSFAGLSGSIDLSDPRISSLVERLGREGVEVVGME